MNAFTFRQGPVLDRKLALSSCLPVLAVNSGGERKVLIKLDEGVLFIGEDGTLTQGSPEYALLNYKPVPHAGLTVSIEVRATR